MYILERWWFITSFVLNQKHRPAADTLFGDAALHWPSYDMKCKHNLGVSVNVQRFETLQVVRFFQIKYYPILKKLIKIYFLNFLANEGHLFYTGQWCAPWHNSMCFSNGPVTPCHTAGCCLVAQGAPDDLIGCFNKPLESRCALLKIPMLYSFFIT